MGSIGERKRSNCLSRRPATALRQSHPAAPGNRTAPCAVPVAPHPSYVHEPSAGSKAVKLAVSGSGLTSPRSFTERTSRQ